jgi:hypothetical protein
MYAPLAHLLGSISVLSRYFFATAGNGRERRSTVGEIPPPLPAQIFCFSRLYLHARPPLRSDFISLRALAPARFRAPSSLFCARLHPCVGLPCKLLGRPPSPSRLSARVRHRLGDQLPLQPCGSKRSLLLPWPCLLYRRAPSRELPYSHGG